MVLFFQNIKCVFHRNIPGLAWLEGGQDDAVRSFAVVVNLVAPEGYCSVTNPNTLFVLIVESWI